MTSAPYPGPGELDELGGIDWDDTGSILSACTPVLEAFSRDPGLLPALLGNLSGSEHLQSMCECYDFLDKLVLHDAAQAQVRVRLHLYRPGYFDRPHNHRWSFASHILRGQYLHRLYGRDDLFAEDTDPDSLRPICERTEGPGAIYALHHTSVHAVQAAADTISVLLRGPAAKDRFLILDRHAGGSFWAYGAARETPAQRASKRMTTSQISETITRVRLLTTPGTLTARTMETQ